MNNNIVVSSANAINRRYAVWFLLLTWGLFAQAYECTHRGGYNSDCRIPCSTCLYVNGQWIRWWLLSSPPSPCSCTVYGGYGGTCALDLSCGNEPAVAMDLKGPISYNTESVTLTGFCDGGECTGTMGPIQPPQDRLAYTSQPCISGGG
jgi:hypothetical protein